MHITFINRKLQRIFNEEAKLVIEYGAQRAKKIEMRLAVLGTAACLKDIPHTPPERRHELAGKRKGEFAVDINGGDRLIFKPDHKPVPTLNDGGIDLQQVTAITILSVENYH